MRLHHLLNKLKIESGDMDNNRSIVVSGIADRSMDVKKGFVFVAISGFKTNGHKYINEAICNGASVIIGEGDIAGLPVPYIKVKNSRKALGVIASNFYSNPSKKKNVIGITGTNGKTTTSYMLKHILETSGLTCTIIGTNQNVINGEIVQSVNTTPSSLVLQRILSASKDDVVIMEVSSHGLMQSRVEGVEFDFCLFTNMSHDHLDYHNSMEEYFRVKTSLFEKLKDNGCAVINIDDFWGERLVKLLKGKVKNKLYTIGQSASSHLRIINIRNSGITVKVKNDLVRICPFIPGIHNLYNALMAVATANLLNIDEQGILASINEFKGVEGRFEVIGLDNGATAVVDYAHTPDAIFHCLRTAKQCGAKRLIHVFGFRGDRDSSKWQEMLSIASELSDQYILTLDDLNSVSHKKMVELIECFNNNYGNESGVIISDRTLAIKQAMEQSVPGDWIIITGKGHEIYQQNYHLKTVSDRDTIT
ncbi:UDP-N-acetylmuramoyl-L-alanyl-D-glutamate--2,6-diaminopimelate ligase [Virgibacillus oceani]|uniref:UDP-N-acetylmuramoyl-L-alanyl-D-glutamate--2, 6-diaminopimelate ligase n=1 Tax=Virgibacillus oceani TaxID=1479511 RepID=A0A917LVW7_9BACI|nr:UDP-N-acetylmuramoyl-L-alanyl-D-glutamate--2,6-diaminopimelate ligase [Virgibacillus oceani]GGG61200.1 UDP-N-acetylmuramoyl-L-alanyl-D-glutamate--2,6-diaminopimelate ligase [Virgibacillus oceani]